ncbi:helix-turn-helix domain-containing protein [Yinghuangia sp. YIM S09857]|uniref:helix-turn-helix domain-containing protein n=1 Tax=Yinghuangia sp. YIM S09857 TaxID=3436929 RepID=UPI003F5311EB
MSKYADDSAADAAVDLFRALGRQIKLLRERSGLSRAELAERLGYSTDLIESIELGRRVPQEPFLDAADELLEAGGLLTTTKEDVAKAKSKARVRHPAWFLDYARLEREAIELHYYSNHTIPGLFQTEAHARALYAMRTPLLDEEAIEVGVTARLDRQKVLDRWPPPIVTCVVEEVLLHRPIGGHAVHREQLAQLLRRGQLRSVQLQVMPSRREEHSGMSGPFVLITPRHHGQIGYFEGPVDKVSRLLTDAEDVRILAARYGNIRAQALTPSESLALIEKTLGEI